MVRFHEDTQTYKGSKSADIWLTTTNVCLAGSIPVLSTMQKELGIEANCLGRTRDYLLLRKKLVSSNDLNLINSIGQS